MASRSIGVVAALAGVVSLAGCHQPGGAWLSYTGESITYYSTEVQPVSVELVDLRSDDVIFRMDVPPGKQLTIDFKEGDGDDPSLRPDLMQYDVWDIGTRIGRLRNSLTVPTSRSRRIDVFYGGEVAYREPEPLPELRTDEADRPDFWTPEGGPAPVDDRGVRNYDG